MGVSLGEVFYIDGIRLARTIFLFERSIFDDEALTFRATMRAEPLQLQNFIDGRFVEPIGLLSFRAESRNLWLFLENCRRLI
jgi:hypothetical protein